MKTILVDALGTLVYEGEGVYAPLIELLEMYPNQKIALTMATDELMEKWGFDDIPYEIYTTRLDPKKTDPSYYTQMLNHFARAAADVVYIEHDAAAVRTAQSVGITTYLYESETRDIESIKTFLDTHI